MNIVPRNSLFEMDNFFDDFFSPATWENDANKFFKPRVDIKDKKNSYIISAALPGVKKEDVKVTLEDGLLTIQAECKQEDKEEKDGKLIRQERRYGKYSRSFSVGENIKQGDIKANFKDGVLTLEAPKTDISKKEKVRMIDIK